MSKRDSSDQQAPTTQQRNEPAERRLTQQMAGLIASMLATELQPLSEELGTPRRIRGGGYHRAHRVLAYRKAMLSSKRMAFHAQATVRFDRSLTMADLEKAIVKAGYGVAQTRAEEEVLN